MAISAVAEARTRNEMVLEIASQTRSERRSARESEMRHASMRATSTQSAAEPKSVGRVDCYA
ncbi:MAG: hypothetical protein JWM25_466 [Thermoleophilia bacterium]|nr:hypothetical protein [Thermoleophilia bacterium]MCZ4495883.1 hypothetical protein [Thermoleophilia bacterium]